MLLIPARPRIARAAPRLLIPPDEPERWRHWVDQLKQQLHVDVMRLWRRCDLAPQPWIGGSGQAAPAIPGTFTTISTSTTTTTTTTPEGTTDCGDCSGGMSTVWEFTVSGVTNNACANCASYNGTFRVEHVLNCLFHSAETAQCGTADARWKMNSNGTNFVLQAWSNVLGGAAAQWQIAVSSWDCNGPNILSLNFQGGNTCSNWPSTITVSPV